MDIDKILKNINNFEEYIRDSEDVVNKYKNSKINFNMTTVLSLKRIRFFEIEYFDKYFKNGAAITIFERLLYMPASKTWSLLGKDLVSLLQYWLDATRKLMETNEHWWLFLRVLLKFINDLGQKDSSLPNILVEQTAESLFDLATQDKPNLDQRVEILQCLNHNSAESSRQVRFALRNRFGDYFVKLSAHLSSCGHILTQYSIIETLLRWLVPRHDQILRQAVAIKWFPENLYSKTTMDIFLERTWQDFCKDARDFLNSHNETSDLITSVECKSLSVGRVTLISDADRRLSWLDINSATKCISVFLNPRPLEALGLKLAQYTSCETLIMAEENTREARLYRESEVLLTMRMVEPLKLFPSSITIHGEGNLDVKVAVSSRADIARVDRALNSAFGDKYQLMFNLENVMPLSPQDQSTKRYTSSEEETRFSHPAEIKRPKRSGYVASSKVLGLMKSPSTASTSSSVTQFYKKLANLPRLKFDKEVESVCIAPQLSIVTEVSEPDDKRQSHNSSTSTLLLNRCGERRFKAQLNSTTSSDCETAKPKYVLRNISGEDDNSTSFLLTATIGSADESVINDTLERISKHKDYSSDNVVDLLIREALEAKDNLADSGINSGDKKTQLVGDSNNLLVDDSEKQRKENLQAEVCINRNNCTVISNSTSADDSNTEFVNSTPIFVTRRRKPIRRKSEIEQNVEINTMELEKNHKTDTFENNQVFDVQEVEDFFSKHIAQNKLGGITVSPTLAKKIYSENFDIAEEWDTSHIQLNLPDVDIIECLNNMVEKVCSDLEKCSQYLNDLNFENDILNFDRNINTIDNQTNIVDNVLKSIENIDETKNSQVTPKLQKKSTSRFKLRIKAAKGKKRLEKSSETKKKVLPKKTKDKSESPDTDIIHKDSGFTEALSYARTTERSSSSSSKRRKLFNHNSDKVIVADEQSMESDEDNLILSKLQNKSSSTTPKSMNRLYEQSTHHITPKSKTNTNQEKGKQIQNRIRKPRQKKGKSGITQVSPRTKKNNEIFDLLKTEISDNKNIIINKVPLKGAEIYNFTSDSDDDFAVENLKILKKRSSNSTLVSNESVRTKRGRLTNRPKYSESGESAEETKKKLKPKRKPRTKRQNKNTKAKKIYSEELHSVIDETMRDRPMDILNTSFTIESRTDPTTFNKEKEPILQEAPRIEFITDNIADDQSTIKICKSATSNKTRKLSLTSKSDSNEQNIQESTTSGGKNERSLRSLVRSAIDTRTTDEKESSLPSLLIEVAPSRKPETVSSVCTEKLKEYKRIYQEITDASTSHVPSGPEINETPQKNIQSDAFSPRHEVPRNSQDNLLTDITFREPYNTRKSRTSNENTPPSKDRTCSKIIEVKKEIYQLKRSRRGNSKIEIIDISEIYSENSSIGLNARGVMDGTPPPDEALLEESVVPRDLEIEELNESVKNYHYELVKTISNNNIEPDVTELKRKNDDSSSNISKKSNISNRTPVVSLPQLSPKDISRWLPSRRSTTTSESQNSAIESPIPSKKSQINKSPQTRNSPTYKLIKESTINEKENRISQKCTPKKPTDKYEVYRSAISPIILPNALNLTRNTRSSKQSDKGSSSQSSPKSATKRSMPRNIEPAKKMKFDIFESHETNRIGKVKDWLEKSVPSVSKLPVDLSNDSSEIIKILMEKLDTTLKEINDMTGAKYASMFVDLRQDFEEMRNEQQSLFKVVVNDILKSMMTIIDVKFMDLDKRMRVMQAKFMEKFETQSCKVVGTDTAMKCAMVRLLREDLQAVADHLAKRTQRKEKDNLPKQL